MLERSIQVTYLLDKRGKLLTRILSQGGIIPGNLLYMYLTRLSLYFFFPQGSRKSLHGKDAELAANTGRRTRQNFTER